MHCNGLKVFLKEHYFKIILQLSSFYRCMNVSQILSILTFNAISYLWCFLCIKCLIYPLDKRNTKKQKNKPADFIVNTCISVKFFPKKQQNNKITFYEKFKK